MAVVKPDEWVVIIDSENDTVTSQLSDSSSHSSSGQEAEALAQAILQASDIDAILLKSSEYSQYSQHSQHSQHSAPDTHMLSKSILSSSSLAVKVQTVLLCLIITHCIGSIVYLRYLYKRRTPQTP
jgi:hypothetical protein